MLMFNLQAVLIYMDEENLTERQINNKLKRLKWQRFLFGFQAVLTQSDNILRLLEDDEILKLDSVKVQ
jgi:hypothetical protein